MEYALNINGLRYQIKPFIEVVLLRAEIE